MCGSDIARRSRIKTTEQPSPIPDPQAQAQPLVGHYESFCQEKFNPAYRCRTKLSLGFRAGGCGIFVKPNPTLLVHPAAAVLPLYGCCCLSSHIYYFVIYEHVMNYSAIDWDMRREKSLTRGWKRAPIFAANRTLETPFARSNVISTRCIHETWSTFRM